MEEPRTLIIDDALANSFVVHATDDIKDDHRLTCKSHLHRLCGICSDEFSFRENAVTSL